MLKRSFVHVADEERERVVTRMREKEREGQEGEEGRRREKERERERDKSKAKGKRAPECRERGSSHRDRLARKSRRDGCRAKFMNLEPRRLVSRWPRDWRSDGD